MKNMKTLKTMIAGLLAAAAFSAPAAAFDLDSIQVPDIEGIESVSTMRAPVPVARPVQIPAEELIGLTAEATIPFAAVKRGLEQVAASDPRVTITDPLLPVAIKVGDFMRLQNVHINIGGINVDPVITLKPYLAGRNSLAIRVQRVQLHVEMQPDRNKAAVPQMSQEDIMAQVMDVAIAGIMKALDDRFAAQQMPMKASDVLTLRYDKAAWTLKADVKTSFVQKYLPANLFARPDITGFGLYEKGLTLKVSTR
ncbi:MAG TPA: hypothetical protein DDW67_06315 [Elusimicrobia bacterium]|nr:hypothetical protein [Elusimicrobiota bacterium]